jgi:hypothetical protein
MTPDRIDAEHHAVARRLAERGYRVTIAYARRGFVVRNPDLTRPPFTGEGCFISFRKAKRLFT